MAILKLTVVTPVYNEEEVIDQFYRRTRSVLDEIEGIDARILFVVDRCTDNSLEILRAIATTDARVQVIALSSRFGHQMSLLAGMENALDADAILMMDSDLQHPPELIPEMLDHFRSGFEVVYTIRSDTEDRSPLRKLLGNAFYCGLGKLSPVPINANAADFRLISRRVARIFTNGFKERNVFLRGLFSWIGFRQISVEFVAEARFAGRSKYSVSRIIQLALTAVLSFSAKPLQFAMLLGAALAALSFFYLAILVINFFIDRSIPSGWTTLAALLLLFNGVQLIAVGIIGTYIGAIYDEVKGRPRYIIDETINLQ